MHRSAKAVLIGLGSAAASVVLVVLGANAASAEEAGPTFNGEPIVAAPTYNGQPIVAASVPLVVAPVVAAPAAAPVVPEFKAAAVTDPGSVPMYNGQPLESMKSTIENTAPLTGPSTANAAPAPPVGSGRRVVYSIHQHRVWLIEENGEVAHSYLVSGKASLPAWASTRCSPAARGPIRARCACGTWFASPVARVLPSASTRSRSTDEAPRSSHSANSDSSEAVGAFASHPTMPGACGTGLLWAHGSR